MTTRATQPQPIASEPPESQPHLTIAATWKDPQTHALYVHQDLVKTQEPWAEEAHIAPMSVIERFGDIESFVRYVKRYARKGTTHVTWSSLGVAAILDYADDASAAPGRCLWRGTMPFQASAQWRAWMAFANNQNVSQKTAVEKLEDLAADVVDPSPVDLMALLRGLRGTVNAKADTELRPDGTSKVAFERDTKVASASALELPASFAIAIPVLKGHGDSDGRPVLYKLDVRLRVSVDDSAKLTLRFAIPSAERVLEDVYADRVAAAKALLGSDFDLLRASD